MSKPSGWVAVNVSAHDLVAADLVGHVGRVIPERWLSEGKMGVEISESVVMAEPQLAGSTLHELSSLGVSIALDDFGPVTPRSPT